MKITLNGSARELAGETPLSNLLDELGLTGKPVVVELNREALLPREIGGAVVREGDLIEIVQITAGG